MTVSVNQLQGAIDGLRTCESDRIAGLTAVVYYLMIAGFAVLVISFGLIVWCLLKVDKKINLCWNRLLEKVEDKYASLKKITIDRLAQYHNIYAQDEEEINRRPKDSKLSFKFFRKYIIRFSFLFILSIVLYLVAVLVFYTNIENYLKYRLNFISITENRRTKIIQLSYFTMQQQSFFNLYNTASIYNYTTSPDITVSFNRANDALTELRTEMEKPSIYNYMPSEVWDLLYNQIGQYNDFLKFGLLSGINEYRYESMCIISYNCRYGNFNITQYLNELGELIQVLTSISNLTYTITENQIENELNSLVYFTTFSLLFLVFLYVFFYLPYLTQQQKMVQKIDFMIRITPETPSSK